MSPKAPITAYVKWYAMCVHARCTNKVRVQSEVDAVGFKVARYVFDELIGVYRLAGDSDRMLSRDA